MAEARHLNNAPIKEAIIDLKVVSSRPIDEEVFSGLIGKLGDTYVDEKPIRAGSFQVNFTSGSERFTSEEKVIGHQYSTSDGMFVAQFRKEGFTLSHLPKYTDWSTFKAEAQRLWSIYSSLIGEFKFSRVATRYLNEIPLDIKVPLRFEDYLNHTPSYPDELGDTINNFFYRVSLPIPDWNAICNINQLIGKPDEEEGILPIILDTDVFRSNCGEFSTREAWDLLDNLRDYKNIVFFNMVTDKALEMFE